MSLGNLILEWVKGRFTAVLWLKTGLFRPRFFLPDNVRFWEAIIDRQSVYRYCTGITRSSPLSVMILS